MKISSAAAIAALMLVGCGLSEGGSELDGHPDGKRAAPGSNGTNGEELGTVPGVIPPEQDPVSSTCASSHEQASVFPAYLVVVLDRSESMQNDSKWTSCSTALKSFFSDDRSKDLYASLSLFPYYPPGTTDKSAMSCRRTDYADPTMTMTALPSASLASAIATAPLLWGTPTNAALKGAVDYAQSVRSAHSASKVAIVLATDGVPAGCADNEVSTVAATAATVSATIPTYVIGVGSSLSNLNAIAAAGGTSKAILVSTTSPDDTTRQFQTALAGIRKTLSCDYAMPKPGGATIDLQKVNVTYTPGSGSAKTVGYDPACANGAGWRYDDATNPTKVELCANTCDTVVSDPTGSIDVVFGCTTGRSPGDTANGAPGGGGGGPR